VTPVAPAGRGRDSVGRWTDARPGRRSRHAGSRAARWSVVALGLIGAACGGTTPEGSAPSETVVEAGVDPTGEDVADDVLGSATQDAAGDPVDVSPGTADAAASGTQPADAENATDATDGDGADRPATATTDGDAEAGDAPTERAAEPGSDDAEDAAGEGAAEQPAAAEAPRRSVFAWILGLGPSAPTGPSAFRAYRLLVEGDCQGLLERFDPDHPERLSLVAASASLYRGAAAACLAAFHDERDRWAEAEEAAAAGGVGDGGCLDRAVSALLADLLAAHRDDPEAGFERSTDPSTATAAPCPTLSEVVPAAGPPGTEVRLRGKHLEQGDLRVHVYDGSGLVDEVVPTVTDGDLLMTVDGLTGPATVCLALHATPDWYAAGVTFEVLAAGQDDPAPGGDGAPLCPPTP
jgi:hypothetical protein